MNSFRSYIAIRSAILVALIGVLAYTVYTLDTADQITADSRTAQQVALDTSWEASIEYAEDTAPAGEVTLEVLTDSGTPAIYTMPECATEDSNNCIWLAGERGNKVGKSFADLGGIVYYERTY